MFIRPIQRVTTIIALIASLSLSGLAPETRADINLWPILEITDDATTVLYPLYVHEDSFTMIFPAFYRTNYGRDTHILWPFIKFSDKRPTRIVPLYFADEANYTFFPFIRHTDDYTMWFIPPSYFDRDGDFSAVIPFYARSQNSMLLFPNIYWHRNDLHEVDRWSVWPIMSRRHDADLSRFQMLNFVTERGTDHSKAVFWPLIESERHGRNKQTTVGLLFNHSQRYNTEKDETITETHFPWPLYKRKQITKRGEVTFRDRRFLIFSDKLKDGVRTLRILGIPVSERVQDKRATN